MCSSYEFPTMIKKPKKIGDSFILMCPQEIDEESECDKYEQTFVAVVGDKTEEFSVRCRVFDLSVRGWQVCIFTKRGKIVENCVLTDQGRAMGFELKRTQVSSLSLVADLKYNNKWNS